MSLFKKKEKEDKPKGGILTKLAKKKLMNSMKQAIELSIEQGRILFKDDMIEYTDKKGTKGLYTIDELSTIFWDKFETEFSAMPTISGGVGATLLMFNIKPDDVKDIIIKTRKMEAKI